LAEHLLMEKKERREKEGGGKLKLEIYPAMAPWKV
jgi:hypothetical protein